jgi:PAT family beta-lactamase induction signal transducer AmpG
MYNIATILFTGFISGITLLLSGNTLNYWITEVGVDKSLIGLFSFIAVPYSLSFVWSPILERLKIPVLSKFFGMKMSWIIIINLALGSVLFGISRINPLEQVSLFAIYGFLISFLSSTQDVIFGSIRARIVKSLSQGHVSGIYIFSYRCGMLVSGSGAIFLSIFVTWSSIYQIFGMMVLYVPIVLYILSYKINFEELESSYEIKYNRGFVRFWLDAVDGLGGVKEVLYIITLLILYRLPDNFISIMINPFLLESGYLKLDIAILGKFFGIISAVMGGIFASFIMRYIKIKESMLLFGIIHSLAHLLFIVLNYHHGNIYILTFVVGAESITNGMAMAAYLAFITSLCSGKYSITQYAFLSSMMGVSRAIFPSISGVIVNAFGWNIFFIIVFLISIPSIYILKNICYNRY